MGQKIDLKGQQFSRWTVVRGVTQKSKWGGVLWLCRCVCGVEKTVSSRCLRSGNSKSCGCLKKEKAAKNGRERGAKLTGQRFDRLVVVGRAENQGKKRMWHCVCDCGNETTAATSNLRNGHTRSCGCLNRECVWNKKEVGESCFNALLGTYKLRSKKNGREFSLSRDHFRKLTKQDCFYCGRPPKQEWSADHHNGSYVYNGVDRVDSSKGYTADNCVAACGECNKAKQATSLKDYIAFIVRSYHHIAPMLAPDSERRVLNGVL